MLTFGEIPAWLEALDSEACALGQSLDAQMLALGQPVRLTRGMDATRAEVAGLYCIVAGVLKWTDRDRLARIFHQWSKKLAKSPQ